MSRATPTLFEFVEAKVFTKRIEELASREMLSAIQEELIKDPTRWPVIKGVKGARKGRISDPLDARGKRGSYRYLYLYLPHVQRIYLLYLFGKNEQDNLSQIQVKALAHLSEAIRQETT